MIDNDEKNTTSKKITVRKAAFRKSISPKRVAPKKVMSKEARTLMAELGITSEEAENLCNAGIKNIDDLWAQVGEDDEGIERVAEDIMKVEKDSLVRILADRAVREAERKDAGWLERLSLWLKQLVSSEFSSTADEGDPTLDGRVERH